MVLFLRICISFFIFNTLTSCKHAVKPQTGFLTTIKSPASVNNDVSSTVWQQNQVSNNLTHDCRFELDQNNGLPTCHDSAVVKNVSKRLANVTNGNSTAAKPTNHNNLTATKPKPVATATIRPVVVVTKPTATSARKNTTLKHWKVTTWPKPDKRLGDAVRKMSPNVNSTNHTLETVVMADFKTKYPISMWKEHGFYTDDYMKLINNHWFKFMPPTATSHYILGFLYTVIMVLGCSGNSLVIFMYIKLVRQHMS